MAALDMKAALEGFANERASFEKFDKYLSRFNPLTVMRVERMEIRHSAILAWLMDPKANHGLGTKFLYAILLQSGWITQDVRPNQLSDARVWRERDRIDILILCPELNQVFPIENKVGSKQGTDQLSRTTKAAKRVAKAEGLKLKPSDCRGIFLTLFEEPPEDAGYRQVYYRDIVGILNDEDVLPAKGNGTEQSIFIKHYRETVEEITGMSKSKNDLIKLAKQIYKTHRMAFDFISEHAVTSSFTIAAEQVFGEGHSPGTKMTPTDAEKRPLGDYVHSLQEQWAYSFLPLSWWEPLKKVEDWQGCETWWAGLPLIMWFGLYTGEEPKGKLVLYAEVGPLADHNLRRQLIGTIRAQTVPAGDKSITIGFQTGADGKARKYSRFFKSNSVAIADVSDVDELTDKILLLLTRAQPAIDAVAKALDQFEIVKKTK